MSDNEGQVCCDSTCYKCIGYNVLWLTDVCSLYAEEKVCI